MSEHGESTTGWRLNILDSFSLERDGKTVKIFGISRPDTLLAYLAIHEGYTVPRADVARFLWPDRDVQTGRKLLTEVLFRLNRDLGEVGVPDDFITGDKQLLGLNPHVRTDLEDFKALAREHATATPEDQQRILQEMEELHGRGLLPLMRASQIEKVRANLEELLAQARERVKKNEPALAGHLESGQDSGWFAGDSVSTDVEVLKPPSTETYDLPSLHRLCRLHAERCASLAREAEPHLRGPDRQAWNRRLDRYVPHLRRALEWVTETESWDLGFRIAAPIWRYWLSSEHRAAGRGYLDEIVVRGHTGSRILHAKALQGSGALAAMAGDYPQAIRRLDRALAMWEDLGDKQAYAQTLEDFGVAAYRQGSFAEAQGKYDEALAIYQDLGDREGEMHCLKNAALAALNLDRATDARELLTRRLKLAREHQDTFIEADSLINLATAAQQEEDWTTAEKLTDQSLELFQELQVPLKIGFALRARGNIYQHTARPEEARASFQASLDLGRQLKNFRAAGESLRCLGKLALDQGQYDEAREHLTKALAMLETDGDVEGVRRVTKALESLGDLEEPSR